jgi:hypothetical protein
MISCEGQFCVNSRLEIPIVYTFDDSDVFYQAILCKRSQNCLCVETGDYIEKGKQIYVMTEDYPIDDDDLKIYEGCFGQVGECQKLNLRENVGYVIQVKLYNGHTPVSSRLQAMESNV